MIILAYFFGICALIVWLSSVQVKEKKDILLFQALANFFYAIQYFLFGLLSTGLMNIVSTARSLVFAKTAKEKQQPKVSFLIFFLLIILIFAFLFCKNFLDFLPIIATILYTISGWVKSKSILRYTYILCACIFLYYNFTVETYIPMIGNIGEIISGIISIIRFRKKGNINEKI